MTDKTLLEEIDDYRARYEQLNGSIPEAGGIAFTTVYVDGNPINLTARATNPYDAISGLALSIRLAGKALGATTEKPMPPQAPAPKQDVAAKIVAEAGNAPLAAALSAGVLEVPPPPAGKEWITFDANRLVIIPQPDEKVTLEFFAGSDKWPKVKVNKWPWEGATGLLRHVTSADVSKAANLTLSCRVYYTLGKEFKLDNGKTGNYKDVAHVRPI